MVHTVLPRRTLALVAALAAIAALFLPRPSAASEPALLEIRSLSNRADLVSGGDVLLEVVAPDTEDLDEVVVAVEGRDVTDGFAPSEDGTLRGLVTGLRVGQNTVTASLAGERRAVLVVTNHPIGGPIFSGPQIQPWYCLAGALDAQCNRPPAVSYHYKSSVTGQFAAYDPASPPADVATTTTDQGKTVPYVVRLEVGNMDRSQYRIAVLAEPDETWDRAAGPKAWNHKVYAPHGSGCAMGHSEGQSPNVMLDNALSRGFAVMSTALSHNSENCNLVVQAESIMMAKEHLIETYGDVRYLFGTGCSGGSIAQLHVANAYPGLYDGLTVRCTYPDIPTLDLLDCPALLRYWDDPSKWGAGVVWTEREQAAVAGANSTVCRAWVDAPVLNFSKMFDPRVGVGCDVPEQEPERVYDPETNPAGVRCSFQDYLVNIFGTRPPEDWGPIEEEIGRGFAGRPYDNVGLQYGLRALLAGEITPGQFADLNAKIGSVDLDYDSSPDRVEADPAALEAVYRSGVLNEANNLDRVPIIDQPGWPLAGDNYEIHDIYKSWALRARLDAANGHHGNHVLWYGIDAYPPTGLVTEGLGRPEGRETFDAMDQWLTAIEADDRDVPLEQKVVENRPEAARDICDVPNRELCNEVFGPAASVRWAAGGGIATDVVKCRLKPLLRSDYYPVQFTDEQWAQLEAAFPTGVCDWSQPGVGQQHAVAWQTYEHGPGGRPLGPPPASLPLGRGLQE